ALPGRAAVAREKHPVIAADRNMRLGALGQGQGARRHRVLPLTEDRPVLTPVIAANDEAAGVLPREGGPKAPGLSRVGHQSGHDVTGEGRPGPQRRPCDAAVRRSVKVASRRSAVNSAALEGIDREDSDLRPPNRQAPPGGSEGRGRRHREKGEGDRPAAPSRTFSHDATILAPWRRRTEAGKARSELSRTGVRFRPWLRRFVSRVFPRPLWERDFSRPRKRNPKRCCLWSTGRSFNTSSRKRVPPESSASSS